MNHTIKERDNEDKLSLPHAAIVLRYGANKLWSYHFTERDRRIAVHYAATHGNATITHIDYPLAVRHSNGRRVLYDTPERFPRAFKDKVMAYWQEEMSHE